MDGVDASAKIRQYMDLDYAIRLLETRSYFVKQKQYFPDKHESRLPLKAMFSLQIVEPGSYKGKLTDITESLEIIKKFTESGRMFTACWKTSRQRWGYVSSQPSIILWPHLRMTTLIFVVEGCRIKISMRDKIFWIVYSLKTKHLKRKKKSAFISLQRKT